jgi:menaquinone-dependent protoporphyrinogen IX oxidase
VRCCVAYHTRWGNCREVAEIVGNALGDFGHHVDVIDFSAVQLRPASVDFLALGSPTRFGRASRQMRRFIDTEMPHVPSGMPFAAFGTGMEPDTGVYVPHSAEDIHRLLVAVGLEPVVEPFTGILEGPRGPLADGEFERVAKFGLQIGQLLNRPGQSGFFGGMAAGF